jgi:hypothetical protein
MEFRVPYLQAMQAQAPKMFKELSRTGELERFATLKTRQATLRFQELTKDAPKEPGGHPRAPFAREAEEQVKAEMMQFPTEETAQRDEIHALLGTKPLTPQAG